MRAGEPVAEARERLADADVAIPLLVDDDGRPLGWLSERALDGERVREELRSPAEPVVELDDILRDALCDLLAHEIQYGPVVDADGRVVGVLSIELLSHVIAGGREAVTRRCLAQLADARPRRRRTASPTTASARTGSPTTSTATWIPLWRARRT